MTRVRRAGRVWSGGRESGGQVGEPAFCVVELNGEQQPSSPTGREREYMF